MSKNDELEQFCLVARSQKDRACASIIQQVLKDKRIHVFGELLAVPSVQALRGTDYENALLTLELFAYGNYNDYVSNASKFLELNAMMQQKLRRLTLFSLAANEERISYATLLQSLHLSQQRELEDFIVDSIYSGLITGKLDQMAQIFTVSTVAPRDVRPSQLPELIAQLSLWKARASLARDVLQQNSADIAKGRDEADRQAQQLQLQAEERKNALRERIEQSGGDMMDYEDSAGHYHGNRQQPLGGLRSKSGRAGMIDRFASLSSASRGFSK